MILFQFGINITQGKKVGLYNTFVYLIKISLEFSPKFPVNHKAALI